MSIKIKVRTIIVRQSVSVRWTLSSDHTSTCSISHSPTRSWKRSRREGGRWRGGGSGCRCGGDDNRNLDYLWYELSLHDNNCLLYYDWNLYRRKGYEYGCLCGANLIRLRRREALSWGWF
jgi:hypothetical protein